MDIEKLEELTGLRQSPQVDILYLELDLVPQLYRLPDGKAIVSRLVIRGGFAERRNPIVFECRGSWKPKWYRGGWEADAIRSKVGSYRTEEEAAEAFQTWSREVRGYLDTFKI